jgi:hypothetical protein
MHAPFSPLVPDALKELKRTEIVDYLQHIGTAFANTPAACNIMKGRSRAKKDDLISAYQEWFSGPFKTMSTEQSRPTNGAAQLASQIRDLKSKTPQNRRERRFLEKRIRSLVRQLNKLN